MFKPNIYIGIGAVLLLSYGIYDHVERGVTVRALAAQRLEQVPEVGVTTVHLDRTLLSLDLPGETVPIETSAIGARASGYIARRFVDIGSPVRAGQVLAIIRAPELDRQVARAEAVLAQARANLDLARVTARRSRGLVGGGAVSAQNFDVDRLTQDARAAEQRAADAALAEIAQRRDYTTVTAPFDGVITVRAIEAGDLVSADDSQATRLFVVARTDVLRVRVHVPQDQAQEIAEGTGVRISVPERPGESFRGTVSRTGFSLEAGSRMLPVEIDLDNREGKLKAGLYATIRFDVSHAVPTILIPSEALIYEADGLSVATVDSGNHVKLNKVAVGRDFGDRLEIQGGLVDGSQLILHPPSALRDGAVVSPVEVGLKGA